MYCHSAPFTLHVVWTCRWVRRCAPCSTQLRAYSTLQYTSRGTVQAIESEWIFSFRMNLVVVTWGGGAGMRTLRNWNGCTAYGMPSMSACLLNS